MPDISLVKQDPREVPEAERAIARNFVFGVVDGLGEKGKKQWRRLWNRIMALEPGEMIEISTHQARLGWYHRKHFAFEQTLFEAQERFDDFDQFRVWLKIGAGHVDWEVGPKGTPVPLPKSIKYSRLDQAGMEEFHGNVVNFLRTDKASKALWPHLKQVTQRIDMIESILGEFHE